MGRRQWMVVILVWQGRHRMSIRRPSCLRLYSLCASMSYWEDRHYHCHLKQPGLGVHPQCRRPWLYRDCHDVLTRYVDVVVFVEADVVSLLIYRIAGLETLFVCSICVLVFVHGWCRGHPDLYLRCRDLMEVEWY